jgi:hypothetical protein
VERRPFALRPESGKGDGAVSGIVEIVPRRVQDTMTFHLRLNTDVYYHRKGNILGGAWPAEDFGVHKYFVDRSKALLKSVRLTRNGEAVPLETKNAFMYQAKLPDLNGATMHVELEFFGRTFPMEIDLFASDYARSIRKLTERAAKAGDDLTAARSLAAIGLLDEAYSRYKKILGTDEKLWVEAAKMYSDRGVHARAVEVLRAMAQQFPSSAATWGDLAGELYQTCAYREAAEVCGKAEGMQALRVMCMFLAGDRAEAAKAIAELQGVERDRLLPLRFLAGGPKEDLQKYYESLTPGKKKTILGLLLGQTWENQALQECKTPADTCKAYCYLGWVALQRDDRNAAKGYFDKALATAQTDQFEYRIAQVEREKLK